MTRRRSCVRHGARVRPRAAPHPVMPTPASRRTRTRGALSVRLREIEFLEGELGRDLSQRARRPGAAIAVRANTSAPSSRRASGRPRSTSAPATSPGRPVAALRGGGHRGTLHACTARCGTSTRRPTCTSSSWAGAIVGSSPEMLVRVEGRRVETQPIAGTRPRGATTRRTCGWRGTKRDEKERAEHVMLVDLGRNDLGRVCEYGTVRVPQFMALERYSHVMHLVSRVGGACAEDASARRARACSRPARSRARRRCGRWRSSRNWSRTAARPLRGRGGLPRFRGQPGLLHRHPHHRRYRTASHACRPARASWRTRTRRPNTRRRATRPGR